MSKLPTHIKQFQKRIAVTGGAGFIGSNLLLYLVPRYPDDLFVNIDGLTYAACPLNLGPIETSPNYCFEKIDICDKSALESCFDRYEMSGVIHLAAETHVDRSIIGPAPFVQTNLIGTFNLLEAARRVHERGLPFRFHHVSTDEVFGSLGESGSFTEESPYRPNSPYAATKAGGDHLVRAYHRTYALDVVITNTCNNYGPFQFPEKLIPLVIRNASAGEPIPVYGDGLQRRDWLYVDDHCTALDLVFHSGQSSGSYGIAADCEVANVDLVKQVCRILDERLGGQPRERLIRLIADRPGHDRRYAIDPAKIRRELGWRSAFSLDEGLRRTVAWYLNNRSWLDDCTSGAYREYYSSVYEKRLKEAQ
jgi:dTDP-glucose 4,6-dehydratase